MQLSINIADAQAPRVIDALAAAAGWTATLPDGGTNPETKQQAARRYVVSQMKQSVRAYEMAHSADDLGIT